MSHHHYHHPFHRRPQPAVAFARGLCCGVLSHGQAAHRRLAPSGQRLLARILAVLLPVYRRLVPLVRYLLGHGSAYLRAGYRHLPPATRRRLERGLASGHARLARAVPDPRIRTALLAAPAVIVALAVAVPLSVVTGAPAGGVRTASMAGVPPASLELAARGQGRTASAAPVVPAPPSKVLDYQFQLQDTYYFCGPAATRIALSARGHLVSQQEMAGLLGTTTSGTNSAYDTTRALNQVNGDAFYHTTEIRGATATPGQVAQLRADVVRAISNGYPVVANIAGTTTDTLGGVHDYGGGHYLTVVGYRDQGGGVLIADPADPAGDGSYWLTVNALADWIATRGYSA